MLVGGVMLIHSMLIKRGDCFGLWGPSLMSEWAPEGLSVVSELLSEIVTFRGFVLATLVDVRCTLTPPDLDPV